MFTKPVYIRKAKATFEWTNQCQFKEPDYKLLIPNATLRRRMSRIVRMGVATGLQCLGETNETKPVDAILTATGLGCLADTEKFMHTILDNDEQLLTPTAFIQSTFNTIGAQIALLTTNHCYNNTYVHRAFSLESALLDAALLFQEEEASTVLVGALDEMTPALQTILGRFGYWKQHKPGEGAAFFLLSDLQTPDCCGQLLDMDLFSGEYPMEQIDYRMREFLHRNAEEDALILYPEDYKSYCGEYPTAMSFALWYACHRIQEQDSPRSFLLYNSFLGNHSFILIKKM